MEESKTENQKTLLIRKLASSLANIYCKHIDENNPSLTKQKTKLLKIKPSQSLKPYERCEYKVVDRPFIQMFKPQEEEVGIKSKLLKKANKTTVIKKRALKTSKVSNLYYDPGGESVKRYRELFTLKNSPGIRTVTIIQEAVKIHNQVLKRARLKKIYIGKKKKRKEEERSLTDSQLATSFNDDYSSNRTVKAKHLQAKVFVDTVPTRKPVSEDHNVTIQKKLSKLLFPTKDFMERNKRKKTIEKSFSHSGNKSLPLAQEKSFLLPSQEFLSRNMPKKCNEDGDFSNRQLFPDYLLRVKTPDLSERSLPVNIVRIGFPDESVLSNSEININSERICTNPSFPSLKDSILKINGPISRNEIKNSEFQKVTSSLETRFGNHLSRRMSDSLRHPLTKNDIVSCLEVNSDGLEINRSNSVNSIPVVNIGFREKVSDKMFFNFNSKPQMKHKHLNQSTPIVTTCFLPKINSKDTFEMGNQRKKTSRAISAFTSRDHQASNLNASLKDVGKKYNTNSTIQLQTRKSFSGLREAIGMDNPSQQIFCNNSKFSSLGSPIGIEKKVKDKPMSNSQSLGSLGHPRGTPKKNISRGDSPFTSYGHKHTNLMNLSEVENLEKNCGFIGHSFERNSARKKLGEIFKCMNKTRSIPPETTSAMAEHFSNFRNFTLPNKFKPFFNGPKNNIIY